jgi:hypothetical protein
MVFDNQTLSYLTTLFDMDGQPGRDSICVHSFPIHRSIRKEVLKMDAENTVNIYYGQRGFLQLRKFN